ncbi:MAG TPA: hypothetical protein VL133_00950 [Devosia sp.]|nr:hypothetical protein [Devosia sp.]
MNLGINLSGAEYEVTGNGATDTHFVFPTQAQIDYYGAKGFSQIRLPLSWERLQPTLNGELNQDMSPNCAT